MIASQDSTADSEESTQFRLAQLREDHEFEKLTQKQYEFVKRRMQADLISTQIQTADLKDSLKTKQEILKQEVEKTRKAKQARNQADLTLRQVMIQIEMDQAERQARLGILETARANKEASLQAKIQRMNRQQIIAEHAANENKD